MVYIVKNNVIDSCTTSTGNTTVDKKPSSTRCLFGPVSDCHVDFFPVSPKQQRQKQVNKQIHMVLTTKSIKNLHYTSRNYVFNTPDRRITTCNPWS